MTFSGFPPAGIALLSVLPSYDATAFAGVRDEWQQLLLEPAREFAADMGQRLAAAVGPGIVTQPKVKGTISPIHRDLRFDPTGPRFKDHLLFRWWEGYPKKTAPSLFVRIDPTSIGFASGLRFASVLSWREFVGDPARAHQLSELVEIAKGDLPSAEIVGRELERPPVPYADDAVADLLRHKTAFHFRWTAPLLHQVHRPELVELAVHELLRVADLHRLLVDEMAIPS